LRAVIARVGADLRQRWLAWLALAVLIGVFAGGVTAVAAGARRTDTAYPRLLAATKAPDMLVVDRVGGASFARFSARELASLPEVAQSGQVDAFTVVQPADTSILAPTDRTVGYRFFTKKLLAGRLPNPDRPDEVDVSFLVASAHHVGVGDTLRLELQPAAGATPVPVSFHVVGVDAAASEFPPEEGSGAGAVWATPSFVRSHRADLAAEPITVMRLVHGPADVNSLQADLSRLGGGKPAEAFAFDSQGVQTQHSIHLQAIALWVLAGLLALAGLLVVAQLFARQSTLESSGYRELRALGMTSGQIWAVGMTRILLIGGVAALITLVTASAASPLFPLGLAGTAEPQPGFTLDLPALAVGMFATLLAVVACGVWPNWHAARRSSFATVRAGALTRHSDPTASVARLGGVPVTMSTGIAFALGRGRGRNAIPLRTTLTAAAIGVAALTGAVVFSASLTRLVDTPGLYGVTWDALIASVSGEGTPPTPALPIVRRDPAVDAVSMGYSGVPSQIGKVGVEAMAVEALRGPLLQPTIVTGHSPSKRDEIVLGTRDLQRLHLHLGDTVHFNVAGLDDPHPLTVVGTAIFPDLSDSLGLGQGAQVTMDTLSQTVGRAIPPPDTILVRFRPGTEQSVAIARLSREIGPNAEISVSPPQQPVDLINFGQVQNLPLMVGGLLGLLAVGTLVHLLVTSIRRRRRDLAVLKVVGFVPGQLRRTILWQANTVSVLAQIGVVAAPTVPVAPVLALVFGALLITCLVALVPARSAARSPVSEILRSD
jgi:hypothetical protein